MTPGPWRSEKNIDAGYDIWGGNDDDVGIVGDSGVENEDDAKLIAAAPDMYKALRSIIAWAMSDHDHYPRKKAMADIRDRAQRALNRCDETPEGD
jgi:hypothetical protein